MRELGIMAEQLRQIRRAEREFLLRAAIDDLIIEPMFLDGLLRAVEETGPSAGEQPGLHPGGLMDDES